MAITLPTSIGNVTIKEAFEGYEAGIGQQGPYINKVYLCPTWASAFPVTNALMGIGRLAVSHPCPESPLLRCVSAVIAPKGEYDVRDGGRPQFNMPLVKASYAVPKYECQPAEDPAGNMSFPNEIAPGQPYVFMEQSVDFDTEVVKLPGRTYAFGDGKVIDTPVAKTIAVASFVLIRRWQTTLPHGPVTKYLNKLNQDVFLGQPKGQIKFRKARSRRTATTGGDRTQDFEIHLQWREADHNHVIRPDTGAFDLITVGGSAFGDSPYKYEDLTQLLR